MRTRLSRHTRIAVIAAAALAATGMSITTTSAVAATTTLTFTPSTAPSGTTVSLAGGGWKALDTVTVSLSGPASATLCNLRADSTGVIPTQACAVPTFVPFGAYTVTGSSSGGITKVATGKLSVTPTTSVTNPNGSLVVTAAAGSGLGAFGTGFAVSSAITVKLDSTNVATNPATPVTNSGGSVSGITYTLPAGTTAGAHTVSLRDGQGHTSSYSLTVYRPTLSLGATAVVAGQSVSVTGAGWPAGDFVQVFLTKVSPATSGFACQVRVDGAGKITPGQACTAPSNIPGAVYQLTGTDVSRYATITSGNVTLSPSVSVLTPGFQPTVTAAAGSVVQLSGSGFGANARISATVDDVDAPTTPTVAKASAQGSVSGVTIVIPATTAAGNRDVVVSDPGGRTATTTIRVYKPTLTVSPANAAAGTPLVVSGAGWPAGDLVSVQLVSASASATVCNVPVNSTGALATPPQQCVVPGNLPFGSYAVTGSDFQRYVTKTGANFALAPSITLTNSGGTPIASGAPGDTLFVQGAGFAAGSTITVKFNNANRTTTPATPTTFSNGAVSGVSFTVPTIADGTYTVSVRDAAGHTATASFQVT